MTDRPSGALNATGRGRRPFIRIEDHQRVEIEFMKRDIAEKDNRIVHLTHQTQKLSSVTNLFYLLLLDLEYCTGEQFLSPGQARPMNFRPRMVFLLWSGER
jgi:hypothetical protein